MFKLESKNTITSKEQDLVKQLTEQFKQTPEGQIQAEQPKEEAVEEEVIEEEVEEEEEVVEEEVEEEEVVEEEEAEVEAQITNSYNDKLNEYLNQDSTLSQIRQGTKNTK